MPDENKMRRNIKKLKAKAVKLSERKACVQRKLRKYPAKIQRIVLRDLRSEISETNRQLSMLSGKSINIRPIGTRPEIRTGETANGFGLWRADNSSLANAFDVSDEPYNYIDDLMLPSLFIGPFKIPDCDGAYLVLVDETDTAKSPILDAYIKSEKLAVQKIDPDDDIVRRYENNKGLIQEEIERRLALHDLGDAQGISIARSARQAYNEHRRSYAEFMLEYEEARLTDKEKKLAMRLRRRYGLISERSFRP